MNKTAIEYGDRNWPVVTGCKRGCDYCWARRIFKRFGWSFEPTLHLDRLDAPLKVRKPCKILTCFTGDLFGPWVKPEWGWQKAILDTVRRADWHTFLFLTKYPENLAQFNPWPDNCWVGATATTSAETERALDWLDIVQAPVRFISFEPLSEEIVLGLSVLDWGIIGQQTNPDRPPIPSWVQGLVDCLDRANAAVFLKDNLHWPEKRQEWPR